MNIERNERINERIHRLHILRKDKMQCSCSNCIKLRKETKVSKEDREVRKARNKDFGPDFIEFDPSISSFFVKKRNPVPLPILGLINTLQQAQEAIKRVRFGFPWSKHFEPGLSIDPYLYDRHKEIRIIVNITTRDRVTGVSMALMTPLRFKLGQPEEGFFKAVRSVFH